jgi:hypothetical protein
MIHYNRIENALTSLADATDRSISLRDDTFEFSGLNSEYVSHQGCSHAPGHHVPQCVVFNNSRYTLIVAASSSYAKFSPPLPEYIYNSATQTERITPTPWRQIPVHLVRPLFKFPATAPAWIEKEGYTIYAMVPDFFLKFDDDGTPIFRPDCKITATISDGQGGDGADTRTLFNENRSEAVDSATGLRFFNGNVWDNNGPLPSGWISDIGDVKPSDEFEGEIPRSIGEFNQCKTSETCPHDANPCPSDCQGKTDSWFWHPRKEG